MNAVLQLEPAPVAPAAPALPVEHRLEFHGTAGEYFRIWIVNVALSLLTLGIYSAWAKVRTERYFYGNTRLDGIPFEYSAQPIPILRGRIVAAVLFGAYLLTAQFAPIWNLAVIAVILAITPLIVVGGLRFRARYSAWRGIHFRFAGRKGAAYALFLGWPLLSLFTMMVLFPWVKWKQQQWLAREHRYGREPFAFEAELGPYYVVYAIATAAVIGLVFGFIAVAAGIGVMAAASGNGGEPAGAVLYAIYGVAMLLYLGYFAVFIGIKTEITNLFWNHVSLGPHRFRSRLGVMAVVGIFLSNAVAIVVSLGLLVPWAKIRLARYRAAHWTLVAQGDFDAFLAGARNEEGAAGAEVGEVFDIDLSI